MRFLIIILLFSNTLAAQTISDLLDDALPTFVVNGVTTVGYAVFNSNAEVTGATINGVAIGASKIVQNIRVENMTNNNNGHGLRFNNCTGVTVRNVFFSGTSITNSDVSGNRAVVFQFGGDNTIEDCFFNNDRGGVYVLSSSSGSNLVQDNEFLNITGPYSAGQFIAFNFNTGGSDTIRRNRGVNYYGESYAEDMISINNSSGVSLSNPIVCEDNIFIGTGPSASGGGIVCGEAGGDYVLIQDNDILDPGNYAFAISVFNSSGNAGIGNSLLNNDAYQTSKPWTNNGLIVWGNTGVAQDCNVQGNRIVVNGGSVNFFSNYTAISGGAVNTPTSLTLGQLAIPDPLITMISEDQVYHLRASKTYMAHIISFANSQDGISQALIERPTADAEADNTITTTSTTLSSSSSAASGNVIADHLWEFVSGPTTPTIVSPTSSSTSVTGMSSNGDYVFRYRVGQENYVSAAPADDVFTYHWDWTTITVNLGGNSSPSASAGSDVALTLPTNSTTLIGSGFDSDGTIASYVWTKKTGPATYTIASPSTSTTGISNLVAGTYVFQLTVTDDDGATDFDDVTVTVNSTPTGRPVMIFRGFQLRFLPRS